MRIVTLCNLKGGVGKSAGVFALAGEYSRLGLRTLCCDMDAQGSLSSSFLGAATVDKLPKRGTAATIFDRNAPPARVADVIQTTPIANIDILPANHFLAEYNVQVTTENAREAHLLRQFLTEVDTTYDICVIDTPPSMLMCSVASMIAAQWVLAPVIAEEPSVQGLSHLQRTLTAVQTNHNPKVRLLGYVLSLHDRRLAVHRAYEQLMRTQYGSQVCAQHVPLTSATKESLIKRVPVTLGVPRSSAATAVRALVAELDARMNNPGDGTNGES